MYEFLGNRVKISYRFSVND